MRPLVFVRRVGLFRVWIDTIIISKPKIFSIQIGKLFQYQLLCKQTQKEQFKILNSGKH